MIKVKAEFDWSDSKDIKNQVKHGISFEEAQLAFFDSNRLIINDEEHSVYETRYFCIGKIDRGIITVRFTYRKNKIRIIGAGFWRKGKRRYERKYGKIHR